MTENQIIYAIGHHEVNRYLQRTFTDSFANAVKIGIAQDAEKRLSNMQSGTPNELQLITTVESDDPKYVEGKLHSIYHTSRIRGEWFNPKTNMINSLKALDRIDADEIKVVSRYRNYSFDSWSRHESLYVHIMKARQGEMELVQYE